jgi:hypothetical protein
VIEPAPMHFVALVPPLDVVPDDVPPDDVVVPLEPPLDPPLDVVPELDEPPSAPGPAPLPVTVDEHATASTRPETDTTSDVVKRTMDRILLHLDQASMRSVTASTVKPNFCARILSGALAP